MSARLKEIQSVFLLKILASLYESNLTMTREKKKEWCFQEGINLTQKFVNKEDIFQSIPDSIYRKNEITPEQLFITRGSTTFTLSSFTRKMEASRTRLLDLTAAWNSFLNSFGEKTGRFFWNYFN